MQSPILSYSPLIHVKVESLWLANRTSWCLAPVWSLSPSYDSEMSRSPVGKTTSICSTCSPSYDSEMSRSPVGKTTSTCSKSVLPKPSVQLSTQCRRPVWVHWKIFQGWGLTQVREKKPAILCSLSTQSFTALSEVLWFFPVFVNQDMMRPKQPEQANLESDFFRSGEDSLSKVLDMSSGYKSAFWYGKQHCKYNILSMEGIMNPYLHALALALGHLQCSTKFSKFEYKNVKGRTLEEGGSKRAGQYSSIMSSKLKTSVSPWARNQAKGAGDPFGWAGIF